MKKTIICLVLFLSICISFIFNLNTAEVIAYSVLDDITARSYIVIDQSGNILVEKNKDEKREVASICKLMTTLLTLEHIENGGFSLDSCLVASHYACSVEGSQAFLDPNNEYKVKDLLKSVIVASANDSAIVLAEGIGGNEENFVKLMNKRASDLGMTNTLYSNSTGLHAGKQYSTARDTAILLNEVSKYETYQKDCQIWMDTFTHPSGRETELVNTNRLIKYYPYCMTGKTGFTDEAGYCLSTTAMKNDLKLTCVVLGCNTSADRFKESMELYNYAYSNFRNDKVVDKNEIIENNIKIINGKDVNIEIRPLEDYYYTKPLIDDREVKIVYELLEKAKAPIVKGDCLGKILIIVEGDIVGEVPVVANENIDKQNLLDIFQKIANNFSMF